MDKQDRNPAVLESVNRRQHRFPLLAGDPSLFHQRRQAVMTAICPPPARPVGQAMPPGGSTGQHLLVGSVQGLIGRDQQPSQDQDQRTAGGEDNEHDNERQGHVGEVPTDQT
ncbi:hypothetical protein [Crossiella sp. CA198]|uniref:hypothetical protein n=1 Tax=Crossiella sp. CA198 TaxID=3455607 RepID=UPI003F8CF956